MDTVHVVAYFKDSWKHVVVFMWGQVLFLGLYSQQFSVCVFMALNNNRVSGTDLCDYGFLKVA